MCFDLSKVGEFSGIKFYKELYRSLKLNKKIVVLSSSPQKNVKLVSFRTSWWCSEVKEIYNKA